jgi:hypothetical protein
MGIMKKSLRKVVEIVGEAIEAVLATPTAAEYVQQEYLPNVYRDL